MLDDNAFDSLEWSFLYAVMQKLGIPIGFLNLVRLLYSNPVARLKINGMIIPQFVLTQGTRHGCPLSPLLFIIAMDPLARHNQERHLHRGLQLHTGPLIASFYADDVMLFVCKPADNLPPLLTEVVRFGVHSGLFIKWTKSEIFLLTHATIPGELEFPL